ncbi:MAG: hypothetical protein ACLFQ7_16395 [Phormidium sp.]|nr:MAG: hypothetical protein HLUCCO16_17505 [Phormidium sp. OSCR]
MLYFRCILQVRRSLQTKLSDPFPQDQRQHPGIDGSLVVGRGQRRETVPVMAAFGDGLSHDWISWSLREPRRWQLNS